MNKCFFFLNDDVEWLYEKTRSVISKEIMGGTDVFTGTRVPVQTVIDYLTAGDCIDEFLEGFQRYDARRS